MYGSWIFGTHEAAVNQSQVTTSQAVFTASLRNFNTTHTRDGGIGHQYRYGTHAETVLHEHARASSLLIRSVGAFPLFPILGLKRDFVITQEDLPLNVPSSLFVRTAYIASGTTTAPLLRPAIQTQPQDYREDFWSYVRTPTPAPSGIVPQRPPFRFTSTRPQEPDVLAVNASDLYQPVGQTGPVAVSLMPPTILGLEDPGVDPTTLLGTAFLRWSAVPGATAYRVYIDGVPQNPPVSSRFFQATGLIVGQQYKFAIVAVAAGIDDSPLSNEIYYEHGTNEFSVVYKYPWGNEFKTGYVLVVKLGTPE